MITEDYTYKIIGAAMEVHREIGAGQLEKPYENALKIELQTQGFRVEQQLGYPIKYKGHFVGDCFTDLVIDKQLIIECKSIAKIGDTEVAQLLGYLKISGLKVGLIFNFRPSSLEHRRVVLNA